MNNITRRHTHLTKLDIKKMAEEDGEKPVEERKVVQLQNIVADALMKLLPPDMKEYVSTTAPPRLFDSANVLDLGNTPSVDAAHNDTTIFRATNRKLLRKGQVNKFTELRTDSEVAARAAQAELLQNANTKNPERTVIVPWTKREGKLSRRDYRVIAQLLWNGIASRKQVGTVFGIAPSSLSDGLRNCMKPPVVKSQLHKHSDFTDFVLEWYTKRKAEAERDQTRNRDAAAIGSPSTVPRITIDQCRADFPNWLRDHRPNSPLLAQGRDFGFHMWSKVLRHNSMRYLIQGRRFEHIEQDRINRRFFCGKILAMDDRFKEATDHSMLSRLWVSSDECHIYERMYEQVEWQALGVARIRSAQAQHQGRRITVWAGINEQSGVCAFKFFTFDESKQSGGVGSEAYGAALTDLRDPKSFLNFQLRCLTPGDVEYRDGFKPILQEDGATMHFRTQIHALFHNDSPFGLQGVGYESEEPHPTDPTKKRYVGSPSLSADLWPIENFWRYVKVCLRQYGTDCSIEQRLKQLKMIFADPLTHTVAQRCMSTFRLRLEICRAPIEDGGTFGGQVRRIHWKRFERIQEEKKRAAAAAAAAAVVEHRE